MDLTCPEGMKRLTVIRHTDMRLKSLDKDQAMYEVARRYGVQVSQLCRYHFGNGGWRVYCDANLNVVEKN